MSTHHQESQSIRQRRGRSSDGLIDSPQNHRSITGEHRIQLSPLGEDDDDNTQSKQMGMVDEVVEQANPVKKCEGCLDIGSLDCTTVVSTGVSFACSLVGNFQSAVAATLSCLATLAAGIPFMSNSASMIKQFKGVNDRLEEAKLERNMDRLERNMDRLERNLNLLEIKRSQLRMNRGQLEMMLDIIVMYNRSEQRDETTSDEEKQRIDDEIAAIQAQIEIVTKNIAGHCIGKARNRIGKQRKRESCYRSVVRGFGHYCLNSFS